MRILLNLIRIDSAISGYSDLTNELKLAIFQSFQTVLLVCADVINAYLSSHFLDHSCTILTPVCLSSMVHSFALCISSDDKRVVDSSLTICSFSADVQDMLITMPFVPRVESGRGVPRRNKPRQATLSSVVPKLRSVRRRASQSPHRIRIESDTSDPKSKSVETSRFPTRRLPPLQFPRDSGGSSGHSSPQSVYSSASFFSSNGSPTSSRSSPPSSHGSYQQFSSMLPEGYSRNHLPRIQVSSLLSDPRNLLYHLEVVQQPQRAAEFSNYPLSRLPVTPPIIVRLDIHDASGNPVVPEAELPFLIAHLSLYNENGLERVDRSPTQSGFGSAPVLYGNLVSSIEQLEDLQGNRGLFFLFPDVSIQWRGRYQLGITLLQISR
ncbi:velvet factor-domain-containing protein [Lentinula edodes]|uniref:Velvet factor-domain-containing protein n=1 Tax=Lentinula lateritia TaxID=40482 RepID=A0A9W9AZ52_9AGAR|nr:velvet factor-domain-containing protein [Lentinula edodes]